MKTEHSIWALTESFWSWVKRSDQAHESDHVQVEQVRQRILGALLRAGISGHSKLIYRVIQAPELLDLWYLRGEVMRTLATQTTEADASYRVAEISSFFVGLLPPGLAKAHRSTLHNARAARGHAHVHPPIAVVRESIMQAAIRQGALQPAAH